MKTRQLFTYGWVLLLFVMFSCSDAEDETVVPNYVGT